MRRPHVVADEHRFDARRVRNCDASLWLQTPPLPPDFRAPLAYILHIKFVEARIFVAVMIFGVNEDVGEARPMKVCKRASGRQPIARRALRATDRRRGWRARR